jgi:serine/alanine adding enzyme
VSVTIINALPEEEWRRFVEDHPGGSIFHTPEMFEVFSRTEGYQPELWAATEDDRVLALLLPVRITLMNGLLRYLTTRSVVYGSVLYAPGDEGQEALAALLHTYARDVKGAQLFTELRNVSPLSGVQPVLNGAGFSYEDNLNYLIDLDQPQEAIWQRINKGGRKNVRRSLKKGAIVEEATERQQVAIAYQFLQQVYSRVQVPLASPTLFEAAFDVLSPQGMLKIFLARVDGHYVGARLLLLYKGTITDWYAGDDRAFSAYYLNELLVWHTLEWGIERGFRLFDFGGAGKPDVEYGPRKFKAKFGGTLVNYGRNTYVHAPIRLGISRVGYQLARKLL